MFYEIYPPSNRTIDHAGVHFAEEIREVQEVLIAFRNEKKEKGFEKMTSFHVNTKNQIFCLTFKISITCSTK